MLDLHFESMPLCPGKALMSNLKLALHPRDPVHPFSLIMNVLIDPGTRHPVALIR